MLINRDNYESIFLLYVDNELSAADRLIVEEFVAANEDLLQEMEILQAAVLPGEDLVFVPKTMLYKNETPVESVQESLLLLLDKELSGEAKDNLVQQLEANPQIKDEWDVLQRTVLDDKERIVFEDKKSLYRRSERVIPMWFWRAAAAVLVGIGIFTGIILYNDENRNDGIAAESKPETKTAIERAQGQVTKPVTKDENLLPGEDKTIKLVDYNKITPESQNRILVSSKDAGKKREAKLKDRDNKQTAEINLVKRDNAPEKETILPRNDTQDMAVNESPVKAESANSIINDADDVGKIKNSFARLAVNEEDPDRFLNMEEDKVTRSKLGGLFRQVKRVVERNTKIKTSNGLRIGGFEIAIK